MKLKNLIIMGNECDVFNGSLDGWDTSNVTEFRSLSNMTEKQKKYCFENNLVGFYPLIGAACMIDGEIKQYFNTLV